MNEISYELRVMNFYLRAVGCLPVCRRAQGDCRPGGYIVSRGFGGFPLFQFENLKIGQFENGFKTPSYKAFRFLIGNCRPGDYIVSRGLGGFPL